MSNLAHKSETLEEKTQPLKGKALVLDFGSVISLSVFEKRSDIARRLGVPVSDIPWVGPLDPSSDPLWADMQADKITERDYWAEMSKSVGKLVGEDWKPLDFLKAATSKDINRDIRPQVVELVMKAKKNGASVGVLSNELELFYGADALATVKVLSEMDHIVDATHTRILKPDPRAYSEILSALKVEAKDAVFVDDQQRNVKGAVDFGMKGVFFDVRDPDGTCEKVWKELEAL